MNEKLLDDFVSLLRKLCVDKNEDIPDEAVSMFQTLMNGADKKYTKSVLRKLTNVQLGEPKLGLTFVGPRDIEHYDLIVKEIKERHPRILSTIRSGMVHLAA